jgi:hypothetical protein
MDKNKDISDAVEHLTGDLTDEQIDSLGRPYAGLGGIEDYRAFARSIARAAIAAHLARQPKAEQPVTAVPPADVIAAADTQLREAVRAITLLIQNREWADVLNLDPDATALWDAIDGMVAEHNRRAEGAAPTAAQAAGRSVAEDLPAIKTWRERVNLFEYHDSARMAASLNAAEAEIAELRAHLARQAQAEPVARLQTEVSDRPFSEGKEFFGIVILDRARCHDGLELFAAPVAPAGAQIPDVIREAVEAAFEDRAGWRTKIAAAVRALDDDGAQNAEAIRNQALEEAAKVAIKLTAIPRDLLGPATTPMKTTAAIGEKIADRIRSLQTGSANTQEGGAA